MLTKCAALVVLSSLALTSEGSFVQAADDAFPLAFLKQHCVECHGGSTSEAGLRLNTLSTDVNHSNFAVWQRVEEVLAAGEMPPSDSPQPDRDETSRLTTWINDRLLDAEADLRNRLPIRSLDRDEYRNTIRDLLALDVSLFDPTLDFPLEVGPAGRETVSLESLTSVYLSAAHKVIERAVQPGAAPKKETHVFEGRFSESRSVCAELLQRSDCETLFVGPNEQDSALTPQGYRGTPAAGNYRITIKASAFNPAEYFEEIKGIEAGESLRLGLEFYKRNGVRPPRAIAYAARGDLSSTQVFELNPDGKLHEYQWDVWLEPSMKFRVSFTNGPKERPSEVWVLNHYPDQWVFPNPQDVDQTDWKNSMLRILMGRYRGPMIHVHQIKIVGPLNDQWPPRSHRILMPAKEPLELRANAEESVRKFAARAFRRPVKTQEIAPILRLVRSKIADGESTDEALKAGYKAILCSASFLFLLETNDPLNSFQIASRLSYFLWSSMPDERLLQLAADGKLTDPEVRRRQAERMIDDPKAASFMQRFPDRWLNLDRPDIAPPDLNTFPMYYQFNLGHWSRLETRMFFEHVVRNDLPVANFIDSDFAFVNYELSKLYDLPGVSGRSLRKVQLSDRRRGGLLGHASVMLATSTGPRTSPILRGVWVLNSLLGDPPAPPPPDVPALEPNLRGMTSLKQRLERHRSDSACNICHRKIDPFGFALEAYDRIGRWREAYDGQNSAIDTSGELVDGTSFNNVDDLKKTLLDREGQLTKCLVEKLFGYARGRTMGISERQEIISLVEELQKRHHGMRQLLLAVVQSELFMRR